MRVEWRYNCAVLSGAQQGSRGVCLFYGMVSLVLIFQTNVPRFASLKFLNDIR